MPSKQGGDYTIDTADYEPDEAKLDEVVRLVQAERRHLSDDDIRDFVLADWPEGVEHLRWLGNAPTREIADWVITGLCGVARGETETFQRGEYVDCDVCGQTVVHPGGIIRLLVCADCAPSQTNEPGVVVAELA